MNNLYDFISSICKDRDMKLEDLQKKLGVSRSTLYRYMKGINQITPELERCFVDTLNMDKQGAIAFSKLISLSSFDRSLIESRHVLDDFLFGKPAGRKPPADMNMVFYNNDKYLRTLKEMLDFIDSFCMKDKPYGVIKIVNCLEENIYIHLADFVERVFARGLNVEVEHFVGLSETDYLQNASSFINIFPLMKYDQYRLYFNEKETADALANDSLLISFNYIEDGKPLSQFFSASFYEEGMSECIAFTDTYMYNFLSKRYDNLKHSHKNVIRKHENIDFMDDIFTEVSKHGGAYMIKRNPCYDRIPYAVYESLLERTSGEEKAAFLSALAGQELEQDALASALENALRYAKLRINYARTGKNIDVYSAGGLAEFIETGKLTEHLEHFPVFNRNEIRMILEHIKSRNDDTGDEYRLYITQKEISGGEWVIIAAKGYGIFIEYIYPERKKGLLKVLCIESARLASIFCDYIENHIPVNQAMSADDADNFLQSLLDKL